MNSKKELWVLLATFVLPIAAATVFYYWVTSDNNSFNLGTVNHGEFVNPIVTTKEQDVIFSDKTKGTLQGLWTLAYVTNKCDERCVGVLKDMKTIRILMNEDMRRIQRMLLTNSTTDLQEHNVLIATPSEALTQKLSNFPNDSLFLIDPLGNVMMRYNPQTLEIKRAVKDLERLFKYSRIG